MKLKKYNQEHLIEYLDELNDVEKDLLLKQIDHLDFDLIQSIYANRNSEVNLNDNKVTPITGVVLNEDEYKAAFELGVESIKKGEVAVVLMAGGQGTRLGHKGPKGTFDIGLPSKKSLFALQCDRLKSLKRITESNIKWYIMTSEDNHLETVKHFEDNDFFGYDKEYVVFFKQDRLPLMLENGKIAMKSKNEVNLAANGNGGVFSSLKSNGLLEEMKNNNVKWIYLYGVDNAIAKVADPAFVGFTINSGSKISSKAVDKNDPDEKVGVICNRNGHPDIVEYSELPNQLRYEKDANNNLVYRNANIVSHIFSLDFLVDSSGKEIPYHVAHKKVDYYEGNKLVEASEPNGYKFELFLFDMFKYADDMAVMTVKREEEFTPVKNKDGNDSPKTARDYILSEHDKWLKNSGYDVEYGHEVDMSKSYNGESLSNKNLNEITFG